MTGRVASIGDLDVNGQEHVALGSRRYCKNDGS